MPSPTTFTLSEIFSDRAPARLELDEERLLLVAAKDGDQAAMLRLARAYAPALQAVVARHTHAYPDAQPADIEDVQQQAFLGFLESIEAFDPEKHNRLAGVVASYLKLSVNRLHGYQTSFTVPMRTLERFFGILRAAEGDYAAAILLAPQYEMRSETFVAVMDSVRNTTSYDQQSRGAQDGTDNRLGIEPNMRPLWDNAAPDVEDRILVEAAFGALDILEKDVVRLAYGFSDYDPVPDAEVADRLGMSKQLVQRVRTDALGKMRDALGVA